MASDLESELVSRARAAVAAAEVVCEQSEILVGVSTTLREAGMTTRCAWCGRYHVADRWLRLEALPSFGVHARDSHSICEDCVAELRASGMSA